MRRFAGSKSTRRGKVFLGLTAVLLLILATSCAELPIAGTGFVKQVTDPTALKPEDPAYVITIVTDQEFERMIDDFSRIVSGSETDKWLPLWKETTKPLDARFFARRLQEDDEVLDALISFIDSLTTGNRKTLIEKIIQYKNGVENLLRQTNRHAYTVEVKGDAKTKLMRFVSSLKGRTISAPDNMYVDFRDVILLRAIMEPFIFMYENRVELKKMLNELKRLESPRPEDFFVPQFIEFINFISNPGDPSNIFSELANRLNTLAGLKPPTNELSMMDIFKDDVLKINGMNLFLRAIDYVLRYIVELYDYESTQTDERGFRKDNKHTIVTVGEGPNAQLRIMKGPGDGKPFEPIADLDKLDIRFGSLTITKNTKLIDLLRELNDVIPDKVFVIDIKPKTGQTVGSPEFRFLGFKLTLDFPKLNVSSLDLKDNNVTIKNGLFTAEELEKLFTKLSTGKLNEAIDLLDKYCDFFDFSTSTGGWYRFQFDVKVFHVTAPGVRLEASFELKNLPNLSSTSIREYLLRKAVSYMLRQKLLGLKN